MRMINKENVLLLLASWVLHALSLMATAYLIPGVHVEGFVSALLAAFLIGLVNTLVRPILLLLTLPLTVLTLGLFFFVLNGLMFYWAGTFFEGFQVDGFWSAVFASLLYSIFAACMTAAFLRPQVKIEQIR